MSPAAPASCVLGIDSSTQSVKVEVVEITTGLTLKQGRASHPPTSPPTSEQNPGAWWDALLLALDSVRELLPRVVALAIGGQQHGMVLLDSKDSPVRAAKLWNDTTSAAQSARLVNDLSAAGWASQIGSVPGPAFTVTKLAWVFENEPDLVRHVARVGLPHDYLNLRVTGNWITDRGDASGTGYWSPLTGAYVPQILSLTGFDPDQIELPAVADPFQEIGLVANSELHELGLNPGVLVGPGSGDNMAAALGLGLAPGDVVVSLGTSGTAYSSSQTSTADPSGAVAGFADATGHYLPLVCTLNATKVTETIRALVDVGYEEFDHLALGAPMGAHGVTVVPYFDGERTPNKPNSTGAIGGLRPSSSRADLARAAFEGVACGLLDGVNALNACGVDTTGNFFLIGGGAKSAAFRHVFASLADREVVIPDAEETVARGAAVQAACVAGAELPAAIGERWNLSAGEVQPVPPQNPAKSEEPAEAVRHRYSQEAALR